MKKVRKIEKEDFEKASKLVEMLDITEEQAISMVKSSKSDNRLKRPDQIYLNTKTGLDNKIRYEIVPELIVDFNIDQNSRTLIDLLPFFKQPRYKWIAQGDKNNLAMLAIYFNQYLNVEIGTKRENWSIEDFELAYKKLDTMVEYIKKILEQN